MDRQRHRDPSGTERGPRVPADVRTGWAKEVDAKIAELDTGRSVLDAVADQVHDLERNLGASDRARLDQYFTSVRELENRLQASEGWERKPKPVVPGKGTAGPHHPAQYEAKVANMYSLVRLTFETDSTRSVTLMLDSVSTPLVDSAEQSSATATTICRITECPRRNLPNSASSTPGTCACSQISSKSERNTGRRRDAARTDHGPL